MKLRSLILIAFATILLTACNFSLAEDVTPPPGYVAPTPLPTLVLAPAQAPNVVNGKAIFTEKCAACHGETGLGDGAQGIQLGVTVPAFGLTEVARPASPADWFTTVTRGRMDRFMPPFTSLNDQERWDVVAYAMSLHISEEQAAKGKEIFEANCKDCPTDFFKDQQRMSAMSEVELARLAKDGNETLPAFGENLSDDELWDAAAYLRTLSFDYSVDQVAAPTATPEVVASTRSPAVAEAATSPGGTEQASANTTQAAPTGVAEAGFGTVTGSIVNKSDDPLPDGLKVTLRGYDHGADPGASGPQEVLSKEGFVNEDGTYTFENIEMPANRIFLSEIVVDGTTLQSKYAIAEQGASAVAIPPLTLYGMTDDTSLLAIDEVRMFVDYGDTDIQVYGVYSFRNPSDKTVVVDTRGNTNIPFLKMPDGTTALGYETLQDSEPFVNTDNGMAIPPSEGSYGLLAFTSLPKKDTYEIAQQFVLPASTFTLYLPEGVTAEGTGLTDEGVQNIQNFNFAVYTAQNVAAGETLKFTVSGEAKQASESTTSEPAAITTNPNRNLLIGGGVLGIALILAGVWLYLRDRKNGEDLNLSEEAREFESSEDVLDAIVALDDLHRAGKMSDEAYQKRRTELKEILKGMM